MIYIVVATPPVSLLKLFDYIVFRQPETPLSSLRDLNASFLSRGNFLTMENAPNDFYACSIIFISSSVKHCRVGIPAHCNG